MHQRAVLAGDTSGGCRLGWICPKADPRAALKASVLVVGGNSAVSAVGRNARFDGAQQGPFSQPTRLTRTRTSSIAGTSSGAAIGGRASLLAPLSEIPWPQQI